jgi:hypothetical protein
MGLVRAVALIVVLNALALALAADSSSAMTTWSGTCSFTGYSQFWPYRKWVPQPSGYYYRGTGTCDGTLNGEPFKGGATVDNYANMHQPMGCVIGGSTYGGPLYITFYHGTPADSSTAPAPATPHEPSKKEKATTKKKAKHKARKRRKGARRARKTQATSSTTTANPGDPQPPPAPTGPTPDPNAPPQDPNQPPPQPPPPNTGYPMLAAWSDEVNTTNKITSDLWGAYRGFAIGYGGFPDDTNQLNQCGQDGVPGGMLTQTYTTITEMHG